MSRPHHGCRQQGQTSGPAGVVDAALASAPTAAAEGAWSGAAGRAHTPRLPPRPAAGVARGIIKIVAVYRTEPVMVVGETAEGALLECSLPELAHMHERLSPRFWQALVEQYHVFQIR
jgi:hypothetical protein